MVTQTLDLTAPAYLDSLRRQARQVFEQVHLRHNPKALWPYLSNTDMVNYRIGLQPSDYTFAKNEQGGARMRVASSSLGLKIAYEELPYEWLAPHQMSVERLFSQGPVAYMRFESQLQPSPEGGTEAFLYLYFVPKWPSVLLRWIMQRNLREMLRVYQQIDRKVTGPGGVPVTAFLEDPAPFQAQIESLSSQWQDLKPDSPIPAQVAEYVYTAPERYVNRLKPLEIAGLYQLDPSEVLSFCLMAAREGFLQLNWDLCCTSCRGPKAEAIHLQDVAAHARCDSCSIQYDVAFDNNLELTFRPAGHVRQTRQLSFCAGGPANTPHLVAQINLWPRQEKTVNSTLPPGNYRFRSLSAEGWVPFQVGAAGGLAEYRLEMGPMLAAEPDLSLSGNLYLQLSNSQDYLQTLKIEDLTPPAVVTAAHVTALQEFRDMFSVEALTPDTRLNISNQVLLAIHLKNAASLYQQYGDLASFELLQDYYSLFQATIGQYQGGIARKSGESLLAVFQEAGSALLACFELLEAVAAWHETGLTEPAISLQLGLHQGSCIVYGQDSQLDYFGTSVHTVWQLSREASGQDVILSEAAFRDGAVQAILDQYQGTCDSTEFPHWLEGSDEPVSLFRLEIPLDV